MTVAELGARNYGLVMGRKYEIETLIDAPVARVWALLLDFERHAEWATAFAVEGKARAGEAARVHFSLLGRRLSYPVVIERVEQNRELRWQGGPKALVRGSHYFLLEPTGPEARHTRLRHGEEFDGLAVRPLWPLLEKQLGPAYAAFNQQLKQRAESL